MSMRPILRGSTDQSVVIRIIDSTDGTPETAVVYNTSGIDLWYRREGATKTSITEATLAALDSAHSDGGILHIGDGYYRLDLPDAAVASAAGVNGVQIGGTVTGMIVIGCYVPLVSYNPYDSVRMGMTALPNAAADAAGGLPISDAGGLDLDAQISTKITAIHGKLPSKSYLAGSANSDGDIQLDEATGDITATVKASINAEVDSALNTAIPGSPTANSVNERLATMDDAYTATRGGYLDELGAANIPADVDTLKTRIVGTLAAGTHNAQSGDAYARLGAPAGASVSADVAAVKSDTAAILVDTGTTLDGKIDTIDGIVDAILVDTGTTLQGELDGIQADTEDIQSRLPAALVGGRMNSNVAAVNNIAIDGAGTEGDPWGPAS